MQTAKITDTPRHTVDTRHAAYVVTMIIPHLRVKKTRDEPPRYALCQGNHPVNYKCCSVYKDLQHRKKSRSNNNKFIFDKHSNLKSSL